MALMESALRSSEPGTSTWGRRLMIEVQVELKRGLQEQEWHTFLTNDLCFEAKAKYSSDFKVKNNPKSISLEIFSDDFGNDAYCKNISTLNPATMSEGINTLLQILMINVSEGDHHAQMGRQLQYTHSLSNIWQSTPGNIFSLGLDDNWVWVMDQGNEEQKMSTTQRPLDHFLSTSVVFLSPELENEFTEKLPLLVQFLIETAIGYSIMKGFTEMCHQRGTLVNDSFYDSLGHEPNRHVDTPGRSEVKQPSQDSS
ncbi:hypothetical protein U0070_003302 [Myodes glareolus]|uniref:Uncharacterized protein n=1 Tax=Myodes glareolus TaxID=447135 RepID=A0AAW0JA70_MYOGA